MMPHAHTCTYMHTTNSTQGEVPAWVAYINGAAHIQGNAFSNCTSSPWLDLLPGSGGNRFGDTTIYTYEPLRICNLCERT